MSNGNHKYLIGAVVGALAYHIYATKVAGGQ